MKTRVRWGTRNAKTASDIALETGQPMNNDIVGSRMQKSAHDIRVNVDVEDIVKRLGIRYIIRGNQLMMLCRHHDDNRINSWMMQVGGSKNGLFNCYSCGWSGDIYTLVQDVLRCGFRDAVEYVVSGASINVDDVDEEDIDYFSNHKCMMPSKPTIPEIVDIDYGTPCYSYLAGRGFTLLYIRKYGLMDWVSKNRVWIPIVVGGQLISWQGRSYIGSSTRYIYPRGIGRGRYSLFGIDKIDRTCNMLNLCEGPFDCIRLDQSGIVNPVACCGSKLTAEKTMQLAWASNITIWADGDSGGNSFVNDVVMWLGAGRNVWVVVLGDCNDPADYSVSDICDFETDKLSYTDFINSR